MHKQRVLFLCTGNSARSQIAEALLRARAGDQFEVFSAGLEPKGIHPYTKQVMDEVGIDISQQYSKSVREYMGHLHFHYMITVCAHAEANCPTTALGFGEKLHWSFDDPAAVEGTDEEKLSKFRSIRNQIDLQIQVWLSEQVQKQPLLP
jgi:arsenate reductase